MAQAQAAGGWASRHPQIVGALLLVGLHALFLLVRLPAEWAGIKPEAAPLLIGIVQLFYVIPVTLLALKLRHPAVATGIVKCAIVTFLLNLAGCGFMAWQLSKIT